MNKTARAGINYLIGAAITIVLFWFIYKKVTGQVSKIDATTWKQTGPGIYLGISIVLMFVNVGLETFKWSKLVGIVEQTGTIRVFCSYLAGTAFSVITPGSIGDYPGRILYLGRNQTMRYANVSLLGLIAQFLTIYLFGFIGLIYYSGVHPTFKVKLALGLCIAACMVWVIVYLKFETWLDKFGNIKFLNRFAIYFRLLNLIPVKKQFSILGISMLRFGVYTVQYLLLLLWMNVHIPIPTGICLAILFFWIMTVIPTIALGELGVRGSVAIYLFGHYSDNTIGILAATTGLWLLNVVLPAMIGSLLLFRMRLLK